MPQVPLQHQSGGWLGCLCHLGDACPGAGHRRQHGRGWFPIWPLLAPPWPGALGTQTLLCFLKFFVCYSLRIKVCGSGLPPARLAS